jgi:cell division protein FtsI (penicillin-binding protein 3)
MKIVNSAIILFLIACQIKLYLIIHSNIIEKSALNQYKKKNTKKIQRGNIYDKNNIPLQYTKYTYTKNKNYIKPKRTYQFRSTLAVTGLVNNEFCGLSGLEMAYNNYLNTHTDNEFYEKLWRDDTPLTKENNMQKNHLYTTLDAPLSEKIYSLIEKQVTDFGSIYGTVIIMDGQTGAIEVLTQFPQYYPEHSVDEKFIYPLAITQSHEIGSIIKVFLMLAALEEGIVEYDTLINCYGVKEKIIQGKLLTTWKAHGCIPFWQVIKESNNFGVSQIGLKLSERLYDYYKSFGFGQKLDIRINGQHGGILHHTSQWSKRTPLSMSFGYEMSCTLLQLVSAWSLFINDGKRVTPRFTKKEPIIKIDTLCSKKTIETGLRILKLDQDYLKRFGLKKYINGNLYGKTGTANLLINNEYNKEKNSYCFVGHIDQNNTQKIIGIYIYQSNSAKLLASQIALPLFLEIVQIIDTEKKKINTKINNNTE